MGSRAPWQTRLHFGRLLGLHFAVQITRRDAKVTLNLAKLRQKDVKFLLKIDVKITIHFHINFIRRASQKGVKICRKSVNSLCKN